MRLVRALLKPCAATRVARPPLASKLRPARVRLSDARHRQARINSGKVEAMEQIPQRAWLENAAGQHVPLNAHFTVGRKPDNTLAIHDPEQVVSSYHAQIERDEAGHHFIEDRHSTNGTFVNDRKVTRKELRDGDVIRFGSVVVYRFHQPEKQALVQPSGEVNLTTRHFEERLCWLVIGDVKGSSELARQMEGHAFARLVSDWAARCRDLAEDHGGLMANRTGDGWLLVWQEGEGMVQAIAATLSALGRMQRLGQPDFRVVVHRGLVTVGGGVRAGEENVLSMELHRAFRMEKIAARLGQPIVASQEAVESLRTVLPCRDLAGEFELPGFPGRHRFFAVG
jgi:pSer/pThr/pTyr-binding forkhead associated (FHA) protein